MAGEIVSSSHKVKPTAVPTLAHVSHSEPRGLPRGFATAHPFTGKQLVLLNRKKKEEKNKEEKRPRSHHFETMVETIVCRSGDVRGDINTGFLNGGTWMSQPCAVVFAAIGLGL